MPTAAIVWNGRVLFEFNCIPLSISHLVPKINPGLLEPLVGGRVLQAATICVALSGHAVQRKDSSVRQPNGYFRSMLRKAEGGELHLHKSVFGILKRDRGQSDI